MDKLPWDVDLDFPIWQSYNDIVAAHDSHGAEAAGAYERFEFYEQAKTGESATYANVILQKGVVERCVCPRKELNAMSTELLNAMNGAPCACGREHTFSARIHVGKGILKQLPTFITDFAPKKVFVLSDRNTYDAAGYYVCDTLKKAGIDFISYVMTEQLIEPDEKSMGSIVLHYDSTCDLIIGVGSGVINDLGKILSTVAAVPYVIVGTAPSMDGYASATSSMVRDGLKVTVPSRCPDMIIGDTDVLRNAPMHLMKAGLGDMLAKYVSICEWRIAHIVCGEYYCPEVAQLIRIALKRCVDNAQGLLQRDETAVQAVFEGLVIGGVAMNYAGCSRPASGFEHYVSHVIDMRALDQNISAQPHGIQCAVGTLIAAKAYEKLCRTQPDRDIALNYATAFDVADWNAQLLSFLGKGAEAMVAQEAKEGKYDPQKHAQRLDVILANWDTILDIIRQEIPSAASLEALLDSIDAPKTLSDIGVSEALYPMIFQATKDIRDKYVLSRLVWDLGIIKSLL